MTTTAVNYWTHGTDANPRSHEWRYLGRAAQAYRCAICQLQVTKGELKAATDA